MGGSCVELESGGARLVLDLGLPLTAGRDDPIELPDVPGLADGGDPTLLGIVVSHPHLDHYGLLPQAHGSLPIYIGEVSARILREAVFFSPAGIELRPAGFLRDREPFEVGPFRVTPYLVDHSAYDSYALLVEAEGRRLFYSGDLRAHGRKPGCFRRLLAEPPPQVDVLLLEATQIGPANARERDPISEAGLELALAERFSATPGLAVVLAAAQNVDRLVTSYRAARRAGRTLVIDLYTATLAQTLERGTIPQPGSHDVRVYMPNRQRVLVKRSAQFERMRAVARHRVFLDELRAGPSCFALLGQPSTLAEVARGGCLEGASAAWSMWAGYLDHGSGSRVRALLEQHDVPLAILHSSGHAAPSDLRALAAAIDARRVVPIHSAAPERAAGMLPRASTEQDGSWWAP